MGTYEEIISCSKLFDAAWYAKTYGISEDSAAHYLKEGWKIGYDPSDKFSTREYLEINTDVAKAEINPLLHYELYGRSEGRMLCADDVLLDPLAPMAKRIAHGHWPDMLKTLCDHEGMEILEVGSRVVTGCNLRSLFEQANYTGFDLYEGPNVDVAGDAHCLSKYFSKKFDLIFTSAVFEHLAMPWIAANEIIKLLKPGGYVFVETHYSYASHERPWHFFQFSEQALKLLFPRAHGIECIEAGVSNPLVAKFSKAAYPPTLKNMYIRGMYCHSEFLGRKVEDITDLSFEAIDLNELVGGTVYPLPER